MVRILLGAAISAVLTSLFWIWFYGSAPDLSGGPNGQVSAAGDKVTVDPAGAPPVVIAEGVEVGPAGLVIPVAGIKADQLVDTFTAGARRRRPAPRRDRHHGARRDSGVRRGRRHGRENVQFSVRRRDHRLRALARPALGLLLRPSDRPMRRALPKGSG